MNPSENQNTVQASWQNIVESQVESLRFGVVQIVVHDSRVVQIERTEKVRLSHADANTPAEHFKPIQSTGGH